VVEIDVVAAKHGHNPTLHWTGPAERSSYFGSWSALGRPFNVGPLVG
jgi:hypothetical protein